MTVSCIPICILLYLCPLCDLPSGEYSTYIFAQQAIDLIEAQANAGPSAPPMFLYLAFQNIHWPLEVSLSWFTGLSRHRFRFHKHHVMMQAPQSYVDRFDGKTDGVIERQMVLAMTAFLDDAVGNVTAALRSTGLEENTIVVFVSDNGGPTALNGVSDILLA